MKTKKLKITTDEKYEAVEDQKANEEEKQKRVLEMAKLEDKIDSAWQKRNSEKMQRLLGIYNFLKVAYKNAYNEVYETRKR